MTSTILPKIAPGITTRWRRFDELSAPALYELLRFRQQIFVVEQCSPYPDLDGLDQQATHLLLRNGGDLAGYLRVIPAAAGIRIGRVAVAIDWRRQGLGRRLMAEAFSFCREHYSERGIALSAQLHLVPFYQSFGFTAVSEPYDDFGVPHVAMQVPR